MVTLRYHIATIVAVFLSLGIGILLGAGTGQQWLYDQEQELLAHFETRYQQEVESNERLQQQLGEVNTKIEELNNDFGQLLTYNYTPDLQGEAIAVWSAEETVSSEVKAVLGQVGMDVREAGQDAAMLTSGITSEPEVPLLLIGEEMPAWARKLPEGSHFVQVTHVPQSPLEKWQFFQNIRRLIKESETSETLSQPN